jgi:hypothetical protein
VTPPARRLLVLVALIPIGLGTKFYSGPASALVQNYAGALCYEVFWIFAAKAILPRAPMPRIAAGVFLATSVLELLQLSRHPWLEWVRAFFLGRVLIGTSFDPWDFLYYGIGTVLGAFLHQALTQVNPGRASPGNT